MKKQLHGEQLMKKVIKNIIKGAGSTIDIAPPRKRVKLTGRYKTTTSDSIKRDWRMVGDGLYKVISSERKKDVAA